MEALDPIKSQVQIILINAQLLAIRRAVVSLADSVGAKMDGVSFSAWIEQDTYRMRDAFLRSVEDKSPEMAALLQAAFERLKKNPNDPGVSEGDV